MRKADYFAFADMLDRLETSRTEDAFSAAIAAVGDHFGYRYTAYLSKGRTDAMTGRFPNEWLARYIEKSYLDVDPLFRAAFSEYEPLFWHSEQFRRGSPKVRRFFAEADDFEIRSGLMIPVVNPFGGAATVSFTGLSDPSRDQLASERLTTLRLMCSAFDATYRERLPAAAPTPAPTELSQREAQVLTWASRGKGLAEIGEILGLHQRTVALHISTAKTKLGATSLAHAVALAIRQGAVALL